VSFGGATVLAETEREVVTNRRITSWWIIRVYHIVHLLPVSTEGWHTYKAVVFENRLPLPQGLYVIKISPGKIHTIKGLLFYSRDDLPVQKLKEQSGLLQET
jgi:hypothetical protein